MSSWVSGGVSSYPGSLNGALIEISWRVDCTVPKKDFSVFAPRSGSWVSTSDRNDDHMTVEGRAKMTNG
jgi:hypothetical protein